MVKTLPTRTDAYVLCPCGGTAAIATVAPIPDEPDHMRHTYACLECGKEMKFDVAKKAQESVKEQGKEQGREQAMAEPLVVVIPHRLGKDEALRRIKEGLGRARGEFARFLTIENESWDDNRLTFGARAMGQSATGFIDVGEENVRLEVTLPCLLAKFAAAAQRVIGQKGQLLLDKK